MSHWGLQPSSRLICESPRGEIPARPRSSPRMKFKKAYKPAFHYQAVFGFFQPLFFRIMILAMSEVEAGNRRGLYWECPGAPPHSHLPRRTGHRLDARVGRQGQDDGVPPDEALVGGLPSLEPSPHSLLCRRDLDGCRSWSFHRFLLQGNSSTTCSEPHAPLQTLPPFRMAAIDFRS
jgi:hypothetical protein